MQASERKRGQIPLREGNPFTKLTIPISIGQGNIPKGEQCAVSKGAGHSVWRYSRAVPRPHGVVQNRRKGSRHELPLHGRLR